MGVPRLYRYLAERYPLIHQECKNGQTPTFDNLYLDFNGIIHVCTHANNSKSAVESNSSNSIAVVTTAVSGHSVGNESESESFQLSTIYAFVDRLFDIVRPTQLLYVAIDGVAPRAKMNQQRQRRFKVARDRTLNVLQKGKKSNKEENEEEEDEDDDDLRSKKIDASAAILGDGSSSADDVKNGSNDTVNNENGRDNGDGNRNNGNVKDENEDEEEDEEEGEDAANLNANETFDSNCITPGTLYMQKLQRHLEYFFRYKITHDQRWQKIKVIFSGADVPGEGEHKIMDYIRRYKNSPNAQPNIRHCIYGLDADLLLLSLSVHEPHMTLIREDVVLRSKHEKLAAGAKSVRAIESTNDYHFVHISVLRQYLHLEFSTVKITTQFDLERVIDDIVFLTFFIGNDFLPHLPHLHLDGDGLGSLFKLYKTHFLAHGHYLTECGKVFPDKLSTLLALIRDIEISSVAKLLRSNEEAEEAEEEASLLGGEIISPSAVEVVVANKEKEKEKEVKIIEKEKEKEKEKETEKDKETSVTTSPVANKWKSPNTALLMSAPPPSNSSNIPLPPSNWIHPTTTATATTTTGTESSSSESTTTGSTPASLPKPPPDWIASNTKATNSSSDNVAATNALKQLIGIKPQPQSSQPVSSSSTSSTVTTKTTTTTTATTTTAVPTTKSVLEPEKYKKWRDSYVAAKFIRKSLDDGDVANLNEIDDIAIKSRRAFLQGIRWCLRYYTLGCPSWQWFYPYHYAPSAMDLAASNVALEGYLPNMDDDEPLPPLMALLAVLPPSGSYLLPECYAPLLSDANSSLSKFFPREYDIDADEKGRSWRDIAIIPFIEEAKLREEFNKIDSSKLTEEEKSRNKFGEDFCLIYGTFSSHQQQQKLLQQQPQQQQQQQQQKSNNTYLAPNDIKGDVEAFKDIVDCHAVRVKLDLPQLPPIEEREKHWVMRPLPNAKLSMPSFPNVMLIGNGIVNRMKLLPKKISKANANSNDEGVCIETAVINVELPILKTEKELVNMIVGKLVRVDWPFLVEAEAVGLIVEGNCYRLTHKSTISREILDGKVWGDLSSRLVKDYEHHGIIVGNPLSVVVIARVCEGMTQNAEDGNIYKKFAMIETLFPLSTVSPAGPNSNINPRAPISSSLTSTTESKTDNDNSSVHEISTKQVLYLGPEPLHGVAARITSTQTSSSTSTTWVNLELNELPPPPVFKISPYFGWSIVNGIVGKEGYVPSSVAAKQVGLSPLLFSRITSSMIVYPGKIDIGLNFKSESKNLQVLGYARRSSPSSSSSSSSSYETSGVQRFDSKRASFEYSREAVELVKQYKNKFSLLFEKLELMVRQDKFIASHLFPQPTTTAAAATSSSSAAAATTATNVDGSNNDESLSKVLEFLTTLPSFSQQMVSCNIDTISMENIAAIEDRAIAYAKECDVYHQQLDEQSSSKILKNIPLNLTMLPLEGDCRLSDKLAAKIPGVRVVYVSNNGSINFGTTGTVVSVIGSIAEVIFDRPLLSGSTLHGKLKTIRGATLDRFTLLDLTHLTPPSKAAISTTTTTTTTTTTATTTTTTTTNNKNSRSSNNNNNNNNNNKQKQQQQQQQPKGNIFALLDE